MLKSLLRDRLLIFLLLVAVLLRLFSGNEEWVERYYTQGLYPVLSRFLRILLGWIPFSVGDLLYLGAFVFLVVKTWKFLKLLAKRQVKEYLSWILFRKYLRLVLWIYILFNVLWGLNYDRVGIAGQLGLKVERYSAAELNELAEVLQQKLNYYASLTDSNQRIQWQNDGKLFEQGVKDYRQAEKEFPFLMYRSPSIKASLFSAVGHYFGFSGYFNPFTSEAQMNSQEPVFVKPFVLNHEIAHQLGYGKENEASFVSFLVSRNSSSVDFRYAIYYELFYNAVAELSINKDTISSRKLLEGLHPRAIADKRFEREFRSKRKNRMAPYVSDFYDNYLKINNQPGGLATYNEVTAWLIAYRKKFPLSP